MVNDLINEFSLCTYVSLICFLPTAHNHTKRIIISEGACRAAHHSCPDVSGKYCTCEALNRLNLLATQIHIHFFSENTTGIW